MAKFLYESVNASGSLVKGVIEALDRKGAVEHLEKNGLVPVSVQLQAERKSGMLSVSLFEKFTGADRIFLVRNLSTSLKSGLSLNEALEILGQDAEKKVVRDILAKAKGNLENGQPLSACFAAFPEYFPPLFVGMVKAGEASGKLDQSLDILGRLLAKEYGLLKKVKSALTYPVILLLSSIGIVALLMIFVLPKLAKVFLQSGAQLPFLTRILMQISSVLAKSPVLDLAALAVLFWFFWIFLKSSPGKRAAGWLALRLPLSRDLVKKSALVRFTRSLGNLLEAGMPVLEALELSANSVGQVEYRKAILEAKEQVKIGIPLPQALQQVSPGLFPKFFTTLVLVGEKTGSMEQVLKIFADFYEEELDNTLKDLTAYLEPLMLLLMGGVIGAIAFAVLFPMYSLISKFV